MKKYENLKNAFSKIGPKMSMGRSPTANFFFREFFLSKVCQKKFSRSGTSKIDDFGPFFKIDVRNFCQMGKNVFFETSFVYLKSRGNGGAIFGGAPQNFFHKN